MLHQPAFTVAVAYWRS